MIFCPVHWGNPKKETAISNSSSVTIFCEACHGLSVPSSCKTLCTFAFTSAYSFYLNVSFKFLYRLANCSQSVAHSKQLSGFLSSKYAAHSMVYYHNMNTS